MSYPGRQRTGLPSSPCSTVRGSQPVSPPPQKGRPKACRGPPAGTLRFLLYPGGDAPEWHGHKKRPRPAPPLGVNKGSQGLFSRGLNYVGSLPLTVGPPSSGRPAALLAGTAYMVLRASYPLVAKDACRSRRDRFGTIGTRAVHCCRTLGWSHFLRNSRRLQVGLVGAHIPWVCAQVAEFLEDGVAESLSRVTASPTVALVSTVLFFPPFALPPAFTGCPFGPVMGRPAAPRARSTPAGPPP